MRNSIGSLITKVISSFWFLVVVGALGAVLTTSFLNAYGAKMSQAVHDFLNRPTAEERAGFGRLAVNTDLAVNAYSQVAAASLDALVRGAPDYTLAGVGRLARQAEAAQDKAYKEKTEVYYKAPEELKEKCRELNRLSSQCSKLLADLSQKRWERVRKTLSPVEQVFAVEDLREAGYLGATNSYDPVLGFYHFQEEDFAQDARKKSALWLAAIKDPNCRANPQVSTVLIEKVEVQRAGTLNFERGCSTVLSLTFAQFEALSKLTDQSGSALGSPTATKAQEQL